MINSCNIQIIESFHCVITIREQLTPAKKMWKIVERKRDIFLVWDPDGKCMTQVALRENLQTYKLERVQRNELHLRIATGRLR